MLVALAWLLVVSPPAPPMRWHPPVDVALGAFLALNVAALAASTDRHQSVFGEPLQHQGVLTLALYAGSFVVARAVVRDTETLRRLLVALVAGAVVVSGYAIVQAVGLDPIWGHDLPGDRVFSTLGQPNALAAYLVLALPAAVVVARSHRAAAGIAAAAMFVTLVVTLSRGGYLGAAAGAPVLLFGAVGDRDVRRRVVGGVIAMIVAVVVVLAATPGGRAVVRRASGDDPVLEDALAGTTGDISFRAHLDQWRVAVRVIADHPLLGTGQETFPDQFPRASRQVLSPARVRFFDIFRVESPHNVFLGVAAGAGMPALVAYVAFLIAVLGALARAAAATADRGARLVLFAVLAALVGHLVTDCFMTADVTGTWLTWCLAGAAVGVCRSQRQPAAG